MRTLGDSDDWTDAKIAKVVPQSGNALGPQPQSSGCESASPVRETVVFHPVTKHY